MRFPDKAAPWIASAFVVMMGVLAGGAAMRESVTYDEVVHIGAGVSYWQKLDLRLGEEHPPLAKAIAALPLVLSGVRADYSSPSWTISERLFPAYAGQLFFGELLLKHWNDPARTLAMARVPMLAMMLLTGWIVYLYGREIGGPWGGVLSTAVYATTPLFLAYGPLVLTDVPVAFFVLLTLLTAARLWRNPARPAAFWFGLSLAGALLAKFSGPIILPAMALFVLSRWPRLRSAQLRETAVGVAVAIAVTYLVYMIFSRNQPAPVARLLMPLWLYLRGILLVVMNASRPTFLLGHAYPQGVWFYFPVLLLLKSAVGFLLLFSLALFGVRAIPAEAAAHWRLLWITCAVFAGVGLVGKMDIGLRHFSVPLVLLIVMLAPLARIARRGLRITVGLCAGQCVFVALAAYPFYLTYGNVLGSFRPHYELFNDSNLDWDQSLPEVERFVEQHGIAAIGLDHFGYTNSAVNVPRSKIWNCERPAASDGGGWVAVSANMITQVRNCRWLLQFPHEVLGGGSMYVVHLPETMPSLPPPASQYLLMPDGTDARQLFVDVVQDPDVIERSAAQAEAILTQWSSGSPAAKRIVTWLRDGSL